MSYWDWRIDGTKNRYGSGAAANGFEMCGSVPGDAPEQALKRLAAMDLQWDQLDPDEPITVILGVRQSLDTGTSEDRHQREDGPDAS